MCGIFAAWDPLHILDIKKQTLNSLLSHRGPDFQKIEYYEENNLYLYHARLKIIDTSDNANQPFMSRDGRYSIIFNGEIYNFNNLKKSFFSEYKWSTTSDTEVLIACWEKWGEKSLDYIEGMFSFVIYDKVKNKIFFARDRFGIKPLYYSTNKNSLLISSEIKPIIKYKNSIEPNTKIIASYLSSGLYNHSNQTFFRNIYQLDPGSICEFDLKHGKFIIKKWYILNENLYDLSLLSEDEIIFEAEKRIDYAISSHLVSDVNLGFNVSGGVDSSMLVRTALENLSQAELFNVNYSSYSELPWVKKISEGGNLSAADANHNNIFELLKTTVISQEEPFGGVGVIGYNLLYQLANDKNITVLLDGNGVDEIFLGYKKYHQLHIQSSINEKQKLERINDYQDFWKEDYTHANIGSSLDASNGIKPEVISDYLKKEIELNENYGNRSPREEGYNDLLFSKIPRALRFNDRVSMQHSKELRVPFLDHNLVEFACSIPSEMLISKNGTKSVFREITSKKAGPEIAYATKRSIANPQREWLAKEWKFFVNSIINSKSFEQRNWFNVSEVRETYNQYLSGKKENSFFIWQWINLELWAREFID